MPELMAVIFDMDGVLVDSEPAYDEALDAILRRFGAGEAPEAFKKTLRGLSTYDTWATVRQAYSLEAGVSDLGAMETEFVNAKRERGEILPVPFAFEAMKTLRKGGLKIAVATSNYRQNALTALRQNSAERLVDAVTSVEDVARAKPAPDIFLLAAERLGVAPENCLVIEDAQNGVLAARAAGMQVILFAPASTAERPGACMADAVITSFEGVTPDTIMAMICGGRGDD